MSLIAKHEKAVLDLNSTDPEVLVKALRFIKNNIIGNKTKKGLYISLNIIPKLVDFLKSRDISEPQLRIQAAIVLGSFAYGGEDNVAEIIKYGAIKPLLICISPSNDSTLIEAAARALKAIYKNPTADKNDIFQDDHLKNLITLINSAPLNPKSEREKIASTHIAQLAATIIARCCDTNEQQTQIANAGAFPALIDLLTNGSAKAQEAALDALAFLCRENSDFGRIIVQPTCSVSRNPVKIMFELIRDTSPTMRLTAARCLTHLSRANAIDEYSDDVKLIVLPTLVKLLEEKGSVREEAPHVLAYLIRDNVELQSAACDADAVHKLADIVTHVAEEEASYYESIGDNDKLKENALTAIAAMSSLFDKGRKLVVEAKIIPHIVTAMSHKSYGVRAAACQCTKSLSRSVNILRTSLVDAGIATPLFKLLSDESSDVQTTACATLCNIVMEFSPMKKAILEQGGIEKLVELVQSSNNSLRLNAIWALKNLVCHAESDVKDAVMKVLTYPLLATLIDDSEIDVQEQALNLLRNLVHPKERNIEEVFKGLGEVTLMNILEKRLCWFHSQIIKQTLYVINNIAVGNERHIQAIMARSTILRHLLNYMKNDNSEIRLIAVLCLNNLTWIKDKHIYSQERIRRLRQMGFEDQVKKMINDENLDVRERVKTAISQFAETLVFAGKPQISTMSQENSANLPSYHDYICRHLYNCFRSGEYSNLLVHVPFKEEPYTLHAIVVMKAPYFLSVFTNPGLHFVLDFTNPMSITLNEGDIADINITEEAFSICLGHLYIDHSHMVTGENAHQVLAAAHFLQMSDMCQLASDVACMNISEINVLEYLDWVGLVDNYGHYSQQIRDRAYTFLLHDLPAADSVEDGIMGINYERLRKIYVRLPFDLLKFCLESDRLNVPFGPARIQLAQDVVTIWNHMNENEQAIVSTGFLRHYAVVINRTASRRLKKNR
ncbi:hypothetical protein G9A89_015583 [Geosiphon pyriformis]|nr:hypothetical protein G9A89_015583 [Geosiphon pyriformis]